MDADKRGSRLQKKKTPRSTKTKKRSATNRDQRARKHTEKHLHPTAPSFLFVSFVEPALSLSKGAIRDLSLVGTASSIRCLGAKPLSLHRRLSAFIGGSPGCSSSNILVLIRAIRPFVSFVMPSSSKPQVNTDEGRGRPQIGNHLTARPPPAYHSGRNSPRPQLPGVRATPCTTPFPPSTIAVPRPLSARVLTPSLDSVAAARRVRKKTKKSISNTQCGGRTRCRTRC